MKKATIHITDLMLRAVIGGNDWEKNVRQDIIITIQLVYDAQKAVDTDAMKDAIDYKKLKRRIIDEIEKSHYNLLESLVSRVLSIVMEDKRTLRATVRIEKPGALRYAKTVSVEMSDQRSK
jgi:D-erythro-7,8-dihydroneopterin triphosphate epimerase